MSLKGHRRRSAVSPVGVVAPTPVRGRVEHRVAGRRIWIAGDLPDQRIALAETTPHLDDGVCLPTDAFAKSPPGDVAPCHRRNAKGFAEFRRPSSYMGAKSRNAHSSPRHLQRPA